MELAFIILALFITVAAAAAISLRKMVHSALCLTLSFAGVGAMFLFLGAQFVGFAQILVYVGAIAILIVFAMLLTRNLESKHPIALVSKSWVTGVAIAALVFGCLAICILTNGQSHSLPPLPELTVSKIGDKLMGDYVLPLEATGLLLTAAMIGAVVISLHAAGKEKS